MAKTKSAAKKAADLDRYLLLKEEFMNNTDLTDLTGEIADVIFNQPAIVHMTDATSSANARVSNHFFLMDKTTGHALSQVYARKLGYNLKNIEGFYKEQGRTAGLLHRAATLALDNYDEDGTFYAPELNNLLGFIDSMVRIHEVSGEFKPVDEYGVPYFNRDAQIIISTFRLKVRQYVNELTALIEYNATKVMEETIDKIAHSTEFAEYVKAHFYISIR